MPPVQATIAITPGSGQFLDAVSLTIGPNTVVRETMVLADPTNPTSLATITANNVAPPGANNIGVLPAIANAAAPTYVEGNQVLLSTDLTGALRVNVGSVVASNNITEWNSVALGSPSAYGTGPGAVNVIGVNAFVTNSVAVTGTFFQATQPVSIAGDVEVVQDTAADFNATVVGTGTFVVQASITTLGQQLAAASVPVVLTAAQISTLTPLTTVAVTQSTSPWVVSGTITANQGTSPWVVSLASTTITGTVAVTQSTSPWIVAGSGTAGTAATGVVTVQGIASMTPLLVTATFSAPQHVIVDSGTLTTVSTVTAVTSITNPVAVTGTFFQATQPVSIASGQVASGAFASGSIASGAIASGAIASGAIAAGAAAAGAFADGSVFVRSNAAATFPVTATIAAAQTIAVTNAGTFAVQEATLDAALISQEATTSGIKGLTAFGAVTTAAPTYTTGKSDALSLDVAGNLRVILNAETSKVIGTVNQGTSPWVVSGAVTTSGTATVIGTSTTILAAPSTNHARALTFLANAAAPTFTEGDLVLPSCDLSGHQRVVATGAAASGAAAAGNPVLVGGTAISTGHAKTIAVSETRGMLVVVCNDSAAIDALANNQVGFFYNVNDALTAVLTGGLVFNGASWDRQRSATIGNAVAATGIAAHASYGEYLSTAPAPTTGQYSALQTDNAGSLFVKNTRRSQTAAQGTTITTTTTATAVTATPAASTFADLSQLIITVTPIAGTAIAFTATLSDGTNTYIYDLDTGVIATGGGDLLVANFNPPLPATSAATGWTVALSVNAVVAHITTVVVLQKAS